MTRSSLPHIVRSAALTAVRVQRGLDAAHARDLTAAAASLVRHGLTDAAALPSFARDCLPQPVRLGALHMELALAAASRTSAAWSVGLGPALRPAHAFFERRFGAAAASQHRIAVEVEVVPPHGTPAPASSQGG